uniref:CRISPR system Cms protein Csm4 n=1 Tax=Ignisphaera aggregans TaxID=334771 RepID=A0A7C5UVC2_9CREN
MSLTKVSILLFEKGYHVGWREPRKIIDHATVLRALIYIAHLSSSKKCARLLENGGLFASALLPVLKTDSGCLKLLSPFPHIPCIGKATRIRSLYTTLSALFNILQFVLECHNGGGVPMVIGIDEEAEIMVSCISGKGAKAPKLKVVKSVVCLGNVDCNTVLNYAISEFFDRISEHRNRIDRISGAADVFMLHGINTQTPLWLAFSGDSEAIECAETILEMLQHFGIGGFRSRGWGRFRQITDAKPCSEDENILKSYSGWSIGYNYLLGIMPSGEWLDPRYSYASRAMVMGLAGSSNNEYSLPVIGVMDIGAVIYVKKVPQPYIINLDNGKSVYIFNPVTIHAT